MKNEVQTESEISREDWLNRAAESMRSYLFAPIGETLPPVRVSVGFTGARQSESLKVLGACWKPDAASDGVSQIFIMPTLDNGLRVLDVLAHECIHAIKPNAGHGSEFKRIALKIGLEGPMRATVAGPELRARLEKLVEVLGPYPHAKLNLNDRKKQGTRMLKVECKDCAYICRVTRSQLQRLGTPICPGCKVNMRCDEL